MFRLRKKIMVRSSIFRNKFSQEFQLDIMDCGPACLKIVSRYFGKYYSLQYLRELCGKTREGVSFLDLSYAAEKIGLHTLSANVELMTLHEKVQLPCIVHWENSHFIVVYKTTLKRVYVSDPAKGLIDYSHEEFKKGWCKEGELNGVLLALEPMADFMQRDMEDRSERAKTFENIVGYFTPFRKSFLIIFFVMFIVTGLQGILPFISKAVIDVGIQTRDLNFINLILYANIAIIITDRKSVV